MEISKRGDGATVGHASSKTKPKKVVSRIEIEPADNGGAAVKCYYKNASPAKSGVPQPSYYYEPTMKAYSSIDEAVTAAGAMLGAKPDDEDDED